MRDLNEDQKVSHDVVADKRTGQGPADNLKPAWVGIAYLVAPPLD
jgi:cold shock CspA family protein